ncbi:ArnT family glycosyltransferase [Desulforhopalus sp. 52FAK]
MQNILNFTEQWLGGLSGVLISFSGILLFVLAINAFWDRRIRISELISLAVCCLALTFYTFTTILIQRIFDVEQKSVVIALFSLTLSVFIYTSLRELKISAEARNKGGKLKSTVLSEKTAGRSVRGTSIAVPLIIILSSLVVLCTGLSAPQVMIGDEVTHYYMLTHQAEDLSKPNFYAEIPLAGGEVEERRYPHSFLWHYAGAVIYSLTSESFLSVQIYQMLFFIQLLVVGYLMAKERKGIESRSALLYVLVLASLPLCLVFSVAFYQDVPLAAQVLTAFYFLRRGRWFTASFFLAFAIGIKVTAVLFYPSFFLFLSYWAIKKSGWIRGSAATVCALLIVLCCTWSIGRAIVTYGNASFYPQQQLEKIIKKGHKAITSSIPSVAEKTGISNLNTTLSAQPTKTKEVREKKHPVIANHPGDLRMKVNYLIYGGVVLWMLLFLGVIGVMYNRYQAKRKSESQESNWWLVFVGGTYMVLVAFFTKTAPDARFFLPGLPFLLLPLAEKTVSLPRPKAIISIIATIAILQSGYVLAKSYRLRAITPAVQEGIDFLYKNPPSGHIFMYPEGNYRFFPAQHEWYLGYQLRDFWRGDNDRRIGLLQRYDVSMVIVKKHLISPVDEEITNLGVYPVTFVNEISSDARFDLVFSNSELLMYKVLE